MPELVKLYDQNKDQGLIVIGNHCQEATLCPSVLALMKQLKANFPVISQGRVQGDESKGIPHAYLFDTTGKCVEEGHFQSMKEKIATLLQTSPHWITGGRKLETPVKAVGEGLKAGKGWSWAIAELDKLEKKPDDKAKEECVFLRTAILAEGTRQLTDAQTAETEDPLAAEALYTGLKAGFKKSEIETKADDRLKELKKDKTFQDDLKAAKVVAKVRDLCGMLTGKDGKYDLTAPENKPIVAKITTTAKDLKKNFAESKIALKCLDDLKEKYGLTLP